jgi:chemotaxis response regulator CheB
MARIVVVASSEVARETLADHIEPDDELHVVVPAVEQSRLQWLANDEGDARRRAAEVGDHVARDAPTDSSSVEVKTDPPGQAVRDAIAEHHPDLILLVLRAGEEATWLEDGELVRVPGETDGTPVVHVRV